MGGEDLCLRGSRGRHRNDFCAQSKVKWGGGNGGPWCEWGGMPPPPCYATVPGLVAESFVDSRSTGLFLMLSRLGTSRLDWVPTPSGSTSRVRFLLAVSRSDLVFSMSFILVFRTARWHALWVFAASTIASNSSAGTSWGSTYGPYFSPRSN